MKLFRIFTICCFFTLMPLGIIFGGLTIENTEVSCWESTYYVHNSYLGYYLASEVVHIYEKVWGGDDRHIVTLPAKFRVCTTTSLDTEGRDRRKVAVLTRGKLNNSAGNEFISLPRRGFIEDIGSWVPGWPWFNDPPVETTSITRSRDWDTEQPEDCVIEGEGAAHCVHGGTSLSISGWGFSVGSGTSSFTTGDTASKSYSFSVTERNEIFHGSGSSSGGGSTPPNDSGSGGSTPPSNSGSGSSSGSDSSDPGCSNNPDYNYCTDDGMCSEGSGSGVPGPICGQNYCCCP